MKNSLKILALGSVLPFVVPSAQAQVANLDVQQFAPAPGGDQNFTHVHGAGVLGHLTHSFGLYLNYAYRPLELTIEGTDLKADLLRHQAQADVLAAVGFGKHFQLGIGVPVTFYQAAGEAVGLSIPEVSAQALGDIRIVPKWKIVGGATGGLALEAILTLPTGSAEDYQGNASVTFEPKVALEVPLGAHLRGGVNVGYQLRSSQAQFSLVVGNELTYGAGLAWDVSPQHLTLLAEAFGRAAAGPNTELVVETIPLEANLAARWHVSGGHALTLGAGPGLLTGYGTPTFRTYLGYTWTGSPGPRPIADRDHDGIPDSTDACIDQPEDLDGFQDAEGCPDPDNDEDGIPDTADECPNAPEDVDGFQDANGCPDPDNDGDGIPDTADRCPNEPEDVDAFQDTDGCPDPDNDGDGFLDPQDKCPMAPEDMDGLGDEDGCPETDFDHDGIPDELDKCPKDAEVINGVEDDDGCPDVGKSKVEVTESKIEILEMVYFDTDKATIQERSFNVLNQVVSVLKAHPEITRLEIEGHTDSVGNDTYNQGLSERRVQSVKDYLTQHGIDAARLTAVGYGEARPIADNATAAGRSKNRRVEFTILEVNGVARPRSDKTIETPAAPRPE